jgi:hypothetical protein
MILFLLAALVQDHVRTLDGKCDWIGILDHEVYVAPRFAKSIMRYQVSGDPENIPVTDEENFRIDGFQVKPFVYYINRGSALIRFFPISGAMDTVYTAREIACFSVAGDGDAVVADRLDRALVFLDFSGQPRFAVDQVAAQDLSCRRDTLYALAGRELLIFDRFGNPIRRLDAPEILDRVVAADSGIALFTAGRSYYFWYENGWTRIELPFDISDLAFDDQMLVILGNHGSALYYYRPAGR